MRSMHLSYGLSAVLVLVGTLLACARPAQADTPTPTPQPTPTPSSGAPLNPPCWQYPPGIVIGTPSPTPTPTGTPAASPTGSPTPTPSATPLPACQWPQQSGGGCDGWQLDLPLGVSWCIPWKAWLTDILQAFAQGLGAAAQGVFDWVQGALPYTPDLTGYSDLATMYGSMRALGSALFIGFFMLAALRYLLTTIGNDNAYEAIGAMRRGVMGVLFLQALDPALHLWFTGVNDLAAAINNAPPDSNVGAFAADVLGLNSLIVGAAGLLSPEVLTAAIALAAIFLVLITVITVVRLSGLFVLACLYVIAPVCLVTWVSPDFKGIARWWFASFVTYSLWGVAYALVLKVDIVLLTGNGGPPSDGSAAGKAVIEALMGLTGLTALWRVPRIMDSLLGGLSSGEAGTATVSSWAMRYLGGRLK